MSAQVIPEPKAAGTTTTVDIDLLDNNGARWVGAKVQVTFVAPPNTPAPWLFNGAEFQQYYFFETIGPTGHFQIALPSNLDITPRGEESFWRFDIAPNIDDGRSVPLTVQLSTSAQDLSQAFTYATSLIVQWPVQSIPVPRASGDFDVIITPNDGQLYFDVTMQVLKVWANGGWQVVEGGGGGGGGISYPPPGIAVSQGTAWGTSIDPATLAKQTDLTNYLPLTGGTVNGFITLNGDFFQNGANNFQVGAFWQIFKEGDGTPVLSMGRIAPPTGNGATTDNIVAFLPLFASRDPLQPLEVATKEYVDAQVAGGGGATYPPAGIPVSTGSAWGTSIDPNNSYLKLTGGSVTGQVVINNGGLWMVTGVNLYLGDPYNYFQGLGGSSCMFKMNNNFYIQPWNGSTSIFSINYNVGIGWYTVLLYAPTTIGSDLTVNGATTLSADPTAPLQAATKQYVDNKLTSGYLPLTGGNLSGSLGVTGSISASSTVSGSGFATTGNANFGSLTVTANANIQGDISCVNLGASGQVKALAAPSFVSIPRTTGMVSLTNNPTGLVMVNPNAATDQKFSYIQITNSSSSGTIHFGFQNDAASAGNDYLQAIPGGAKCSIFNICSDTVNFKSGDSSVVYGVLTNGGSLEVNQALITKGTNIAVAQTQCGIVSSDGNITYIDSFGSGSTRGLFQFRQGASSAGLLITSLTFDVNGNAIFIGTVTSQGIATNGAVIFNAMPGSQTIGSNSQLQLGWNIGGGVGETDFINNHGGGGGGFRWYDGATGTVLNSSSQWLMNLDGVGNLTVHGTITASAKPFRITHPLDNTKYLFHGAIEGPEYAVFYRGEGVTNDYGEAEVVLPEYFEALTRKDGRSIILTAIYEDDDEDFGQVAASPVIQGKFKVRSQYAEQGFYWEVKAERADIDRLEIVKDKSERVH